MKHLLCFTMTLLLLLCAGCGQGGTVAPAAATPETSATAAATATATTTTTATTTATTTSTTTATATTTEPTRPQPEEGEVMRVKIDYVFDSLMLAHPVEEDEDPGAIYLVQTQTIASPYGRIFRAGTVVDVVYSHFEEAEEHMPPELLGISYLHKVRNEPSLVDLYAKAFYDIIGSDCRKKG